MGGCVDPRCPPHNQFLYRSTNNLRLGFLETLRSCLRPGVMSWNSMLGLRRPNLRVSFDPSPHCFWVRVTSCGAIPIRRTTSHITFLQLCRYELQLIYSSA